MFQNPVFSSIHFLNYKVFDWMAFSFKCSLQAKKKFSHFYGSLLKYSRKLFHLSLEFVLWDDLSMCMYLPLMSLCLKICCRHSIILILYTVLNKAVRRGQLCDNMEWMDECHVVFPSWFRALCAHLRCTSFATRHVS